MKVFVEGELIDKDEREYKDKTYYTLKIYADGRLENVSVPKTIYEAYTKGEVLTLETSVFVKGTYSLYVKEQ